MLDWAAICANALWLVGLAWLLAVFSWKRAAREQCFAPRERASSLALTVFCLGLCLSVAPLWEKIVWGCLALLNLISGLGLLHRLEAGKQARKKA